MIELSHVTKVFHEGAANELTAVDDVDLVVAGGRTTVLRGPSGSGKTTLLTLIGCLARPTSGRVTLDGEDLSGLPEAFQTDVRRRTFGFVFQRFQLIAGLTALENVMLPAYPLGDPRSTVERRARDLLGELEMADKAGRAVELLSGGEAQRVSVARALINDPRVILADEPTANLDSALSGPLLEILGGLVERGKTLLVTSHDPGVWSHPVIDEVVTMRDGRVVPGDEDEVPGAPVGPTAPEEGAAREDPA